MSFVAALLAAVTGFLLGSIPFGILVLRVAGGPDPRTVGSGNIGATNVVRAGGRRLGALTLLLDAGKGLLAVLLFWQTPAAAVAALAAVLGHCFTPWLRFRGGKGVATFLGVSVAGGLVAPLAFVGAWLAVFGATRVSALAGVTACAVAAGAAALSTAASPAPSAVAAAAALAMASLVVIVRHRSNFAQMAADCRLRSAGGKP